MKTLKNFVRIIFAVLFLSACEDVLDKEPLGQPAVENYYDTEATYLEALTAIYDQVHSGYIAGTHRPGNKGDAMSDDVNIGPTRNATIISGYNYAFDAATNNAGPWGGLYDLISLANIFLERLSDEQDDRSAVARGEAYFLRGWAYHNLAKWYGSSILFTTTPAEAEEFYKPRASSADTWGQAIADLQEAEKRLPPTWDSENLGRATKGSALSYIAKSYLYLEDWDNVVSYTQTVMDLGVYTLAQDYGSNFTHAGENNAESIWEVQYGVSFGPFGWQGEQHNLLQHYGPKGLARKIGFSPNLQGGYEPTVDLFASYDSSDLRIKANFILPGDTLEFDERSLVTPANVDTFKIEWSSTGIANRKWLAPPSTFTNGNAWQSTLNWKLMRYAELLLMHAEASNALGNTAEALSSLNQIRERAGIAPINEVEINQTSLTDSIRLEYRRELAFEAHRFFDLVRWGTIPQVMLNRGFVVGKHELQPIPQGEIDLNPELEQNPNW